MLRTPSIRFTLRSAAVASVTARVAFEGMNSCWQIANQVSLSGASDSLQPVTSGQMQQHRYQIHKLGGGTFLIDMLFCEDSALHLSVHICVLD